MMTDRKFRFTFDQILILCLMFLASMNFFGKYFYFVFVSFGILLLTNKKIKINAMALPLILLSICYVLFLPDARSSVMLILKQFAYPMCFFLGFNFMKSESDDRITVESSEKSIRNIVLVVALGSFAHFLLNMFFNIGSLNRNTIDVWSGSIFSATNQALLGVLILALCWTAIFIQKQILWKIVACIGCVLVLSYNLILSGRMLLILCVLFFVECFIFTMNYSRNQQKMKMVLAIFALVGAVYMLFSFNVGGIRDKILGSNLVLRFQTQAFMEDSRFALKWEYITRMLLHPFGGGEIKAVVGYYAHDIFLDTYNDVGIIGFLFFLVFIGAAITQWILVLRNDLFSPAFRLMLLCVYSAMFFVFFYEPILSGAQWLFCSFCFFQGLLSRVCTKELSYQEVSE